MGIEHTMKRLKGEYYNYNYGEGAPVFHEWTPYTDHSDLFPEYDHEEDFNVDYALRPAKMMVNSRYEYSDRSRWSSDTGDSESSSSDGSRWSSDRRRSENTQAPVAR